MVASSMAMGTPNGGDQIVSKLRLTISMSLDGFVAGPSQSIENPLGIGGENLHDWVVRLEAWRSKHGKSGGEVNESSQVLEESVANIGATIMGRNMFGGHPGSWNPSAPWDGWWGKNPPFHHPVFVVTHHARAPLALEGGTTYHFVTDGIESALEQARLAAGDRDITLAGGAQIAQQYLRAGLVDEMAIHLVPILLGDGERLLDGVSDLHGLTLVRTIATPAVVHLTFARQ
jgi:dihydrofolate reductase